LFKNSALLIKFVHDSYFAVSYEFLENYFEIPKMTYLKYEPSFIFSMQPRRCVKLYVHFFPLTQKNFFKKKHVLSICSTASFTQKSESTIIIREK